MNLAEEELRDVLGLDVVQETTTFMDWGTLKKEGYDTKGNWKYSCGLVVRKGERSQASYEKGKLFTPQQWREQKRQFEQKRMELEEFPERLQRFREFERGIRLGPVIDGRIRAIFKNVPVFHRSQMEPGNFRARTRATLEFCRLFWSQSPHGNYIKRNPDPESQVKWFSKDVSKIKSEMEEFRFLSGQMIQDHINHRDIYGVKAHPGKLQGWVAADLDLHISTGGDPSIFLKQAQALLTFLHGQGWITCLPNGMVSGIHVLKILKTSRPVEKLRLTMRMMLEELSSLHPELEQEAIAAGMKPLKALEIFPHVSLGFRLPLGKGYTVLLDKPLDLIQYHTYQGVPSFGGDVETFMAWEGIEMSVDAKMAFITERVPKNLPDEKRMLKRQIRVERAGESKELGSMSQAMCDGKVLGSMKGQFRQKLTDFFIGKLQKPKSLQVGLLLGAKALWAQDYPFEERADYLLELVQNIEITNPNFSSRINTADWDTIANDIEHVVESVEKLYSASNPPDKIGKSKMILRDWATGMKVLGYEFGDPATWDVARKKVKLEFDPEEVRLITQELVPVLKSDIETAIALVKNVVQVVVNKARKNDGISREYRRAILTDVGIKCRENVKLAESWRVLERIGFIVLTKEGTFRKNHKGKGRANVYRVGDRLSARVFGPNTVELPQWLADEMEATGRSCNWIVAGDDDVNTAGNATGHHGDR